MKKDNSANFKYIPYGLSHDKAKSPWLTLFAAASFFFLINSSTNLNALVPYLANELHFSAAKISFLFACYYYSNILFVLWAGIILDRFSAKKVLVIAYVVATCSILFFALTRSLPIMVGARLALGIVGSFSMLICFHFIKRFYPKERHAFITGLVTAYATCGTLLSQTPLALAIEKLGWQTSLLINFWLGVFLGIFAIIFVQDPLPKMPMPNNNTKLSIRQSIKKIIANPQNWLIGFYSSIYMLPSLFFSISWGMLYLQQVKGFAVIASSYITSFIVIGSIVGPTLIGWLSDRLRSYKSILLANIFCALVILLMIISFKQPSLPIFIILFFLFGLVTSAQVLNYPLVVRNNSPVLGNTVLGFVAVLTALSGTYMVFLGWLLEHPILNDWLIKLAIFAQGGNYNPVMLVLIIFLIASILLVLFIKENNEQNNLI